MIPGKVRRRIQLERVTDRTDGRCWVWQGSITDKGYGLIYLGKDAARRNQLAHRYTYERLVGPIPEGLQIDHLCRNRACCNPRHLEPVTNLENALRSERATRTHCKKAGHPLSGDNLIVKPPGSRGRRQCRTCYYESVREAGQRRQARKDAAKASEAAVKAERVRRVRRGLPVSA